MNIKKQAIEEIIFYLEKQLGDLNIEQRHNVWDINKLSDKQRIIKKKKQELVKIINKLKNGKD